jgi:hypothetical protein
MPKIKHAMSSRQCEIAAESYSACLLAQSGYDVFVQYGARQPHYDLVAVKGKRTIRISVKGSQGSGWMLAVGYVKPGVNYLAAIDKWRSVQPDDVIFMFVGFLNIPLGQAPHVYVARPPEIAIQLKLQRSGRGHGSLQEDTQRHFPGSKYKDKLPGNWCYSTERIETI